MDLVLPTKAYEFALMHRPIIASDTIAIRSMFRPESIVLCNSTSPASFAEAIIDLYQHPEKRARLVANAAEDYIPYRWEIMAERYRQLLLSLCQRHKESRALRLVPVTKTLQQSAEDGTLQILQIQNADE